MKEGDTDDRRSAADTGSTAMESAFLRKDSMLERFSKGMQAKINERIPDKIHAVITESIKNDRSNNGGFKSGEKQAGYKRYDAC